MKQTSPEEKTAQTGMVELVGGPLCGMLTKWPHPDTQTQIPTGRGGYPRYRLEAQSMKGNLTALYVKGT
jgi:hypothetical protein